MQTLSELAATAPLLQAPAVRCLGALGKAFLEQSLKDTIAAYLIKDFHRRTGGSYGPLGIPQRAATRMNDGTYSQDYQLGTVNLTDIQSQPSAEIYYTANVSLAALKCFGTYSNNNTDSAYAVISVYSVNPNNQGKDALVTSYVTPVQDVSPGDVFDQNSTITGAFGNVAQVGGSGINIHVAIWDNEKGDRTKSETRFIHLSMTP